MEASQSTETFAANPFQVLRSENSEAFDQDIQLTDEEVRQVLEKARREKVRLAHVEAKKKEYTERLRQQNQPIVVSAESLYAWVVAQAYEKVTGFELDSFNDKLIALLSLYFASDERFEAEEAGFSLKKGIILSGSRPGQGKTTLMRLFAHNPRCSFAILNCHEIAAAYKREGDITLDLYSGESGTIYGNPFRHTKGGFCFDDLGTETVAKHFGNECNVMESILLTRYSNLFNEAAPLTWQTTHLTTNLTSDQIEGFYGPRIRSRMREMFNVIDLPTETPDRRK